MDRSTFRDAFRKALKDVGLDDVAAMSNRDLDNIAACVGDGLAAGLRRKMKVAVLMHNAEGKMAEMSGIELHWKAPKKGYRKGQAYERTETPIAPAQP